MFFRDAGPKPRPVGSSVDLPPPLPACPERNVSPSATLVLGLTLESNTVVNVIAEWITPLERRILPSTRIQSVICHVRTRVSQRPVGDPVLSTSITIAL